MVVEVGAPEHGNLIAFEKRTGKEVWASANRDPAGHSGGLAPIAVGDVPCLAVATSFGLHVARLDGEESGKNDGRV